MSLEAASKDYLKERTGQRFHAQKVQFTSTCECEPNCQRVLKNTYGCCNFPNIKTLNASNETSWCTTHEQQCPIHTAEDGRN